MCHLISLAFKIVGIQLQPPKRKPVYFHHVHLDWKNNKHPLQHLDLETYGLKTISHSLNNIRNKRNATTNQTKNSGTRKTEYGLRAVEFRKFEI